MDNKPSRHDIPNLDKKQHMPAFVIPLQWRKSQFPLTCFIITMRNKGMYDVTNSENSAPYLNLL